MLTYVRTPKRDGEIYPLMLNCRSISINLSVTQKPDISFH